MPDRPPAPTDLRARLRGVAGFVLDADGVIIMKGDPIPGAIEALASLDRGGIPYRVVTNFSGAHRDTLAARFARADGLVIAPERMITAASAAAAYTAATYPGEPLVVLSAPDAQREFDGQRTVPIDDAEPGSIAAVVIGDAGDDLSFHNMDAVFRLIRGGAAFLAMHKNPWWFTPRGATLDAGALVVGLEFATGQRARVLGKPSPVVFRQALAGLRHDLGRHVDAGDVAMVGDDPDADIRPAQRVGLRGVLVLTGKTDAADVASLGAGRRRPPDAVAPSLAAVVAALD